MDIAQLPYLIREQNPNLMASEDYAMFSRCLFMLRKSKSQNFQDVWVTHETKDKQNGFFVEFGATNGVDGSNTYLLEKEYGWSGILAEPNPVWHTDLRHNRNVTVSHKCIYTKSGETMEFMATDEPDLATLHKYAGTADEHYKKRQIGQKINVETQSLYDLLDTYFAPRTIDYLSIDTEGSEYDILEAFFTKNKKYKIKLITVEHNFNITAREYLFNMLVYHGYERRFNLISRWDDFYRLKGE